MIKVRLTTISGESKIFSLPNRKKVEDFISQLQNNLAPKTSVYVECDLLDIRGTLRGVNK